MAEILDDISYLSQEIGPRPAGTEEEQQAALYIADQMQKRTGFTASIEDFSTQVQPGLVEAICFGIPAVLSLLAIIAGVFAIPAFLISLACAVLYAFELLDRPVLSRLFETGVSQNVVARYTPGTQKNARNRKVVLVAHYDSDKVAAEYSGGLFGIYPLLRKASFIGLVALPVIWLLRILFPIGASVIAATIFNILTAAALIAALVPAMLFFMHKAATYNEAANNNAAGVATMMEVARLIAEGSYSEQELAEQEEALLHSAEEALAAGVVPEGAEIEYLTEEPQTDEERLASAKAAVAALTGQPLREYHVEKIDFTPLAERDDIASYEEMDYGEYGYPEDELEEEYGGLTVDQAQEMIAPSNEFEATQVLERISDEADEGMSQLDSFAETANYFAPTFDEAPLVSQAPSNEPEWFTTGRAKAVKPEGADDVLPRRSRYADILEVAMASSKEHIDEAARMLDEGSLDRISKYQASIAASDPNLNDAPLQDILSDEVKPESADIDLQPTEALEPMTEECADEIETAAPSESGVVLRLEPEPAPAEETEPETEEKSRFDTLIVTEEEDTSADSQTEDESSDGVADDTNAFMPVSSFLQDSPFAPADENDQPAFEAETREEVFEPAIVVEEQPLSQSRYETAFATVAEPEATLPEDEDDEYATDFAEEDSAIDAKAEQTDEDSGLKPLFEPKLGSETDEKERPKRPFGFMPFFGKDNQDGEERKGVFESLRTLIKDDSAADESEEETETSDKLAEALEAEPIEDGDASLTGATTAIDPIDVSTLTASPKQDDAAEAASDAEVEQHDFSEINKPPARRYRDIPLPSVPADDSAANDTAVPRRHSVPLSSNRIPKIALESVMDTPEEEVVTPAAPEPAQPDRIVDNKRAALRNVIPSLSGEFAPIVIPEDTAETNTEVSKAGSFHTAATDSAFAPVGDELVADIPEEERYIHDADDSSYEEETTETGAFAGPGYVEMPESRLGRFFNRFRKQEPAEETSASEWLDVDENFNPTEVGAARGGWESFQNESGTKPPVPEDAKTPSLFDDENSDDDDGDGRSWHGGAFSQLRDKALAAVSNLTSGKDAEEGEEAEEDEVVEDVSEDTAQDSAEDAPASEDTEDSTSAPAKPARTSASLADDAERIAEEVQMVYNFRNPDINTEVWFVALGSEYASNGGMKAFLAEHASDLRGSIIINLEATGAGELSFVEEEGIVFTAKPSSRFKRFLRKASEVTGVAISNTRLAWRESAASYATKRGFQAMTIAGIEDNKPAFLGQGDDVLENIDEAKVAESAQFVLEAIKNI